ncbi:hypothetical protein GCM10010343_11760 [Streptomyces avidinii]|nr:hypothetical protein GCM10010343_11760 [Streptomyces avidinii]
MHPDRAAHVFTVTRQSSDHGPPWLLSSMSLVLLAHLQAGAAVAEGAAGAATATVATAARLMALMPGQRRRPPTKHGTGRSWKTPAPGAPPQGTGAPQAGARTRPPNEPSQNLEPVPRVWTATG